MNGVVETIKEDYSIFIIEDLSDELKDNIKSELVAICHGEKNRNSTLKLYSISNTVTQLLKRYPEDPRKQKGFIGELLLNLIIREYFDLDVISPFFNKEEAASAKKGFDIILFDKGNDSIWITESKAGSVSQVNPQTIDQKINERIGVAESDLDTRLNEKNQTLWLNALNDVALSMNEKDEKETVQNILDNCDDLPGNQFNVALGGIVFHNITDRFQESTISDKLDKVKKSEKFSKIKVIAIQKETYEKVVEFIKEID